MIDHPATWLGRDWIMLTTGVRLRNSAEAQRQLATELAEIGAAALGFGVEVDVVVAGAEFSSPDARARLRAVLVIVLHRRSPPFPAGARHDACVLLIPSVAGGHARRRGGGVVRVPRRRGWDRARGA
jgi:hypothetical protein